MTSLTVDNETHTNIASNNFDLYRFNQSPSPTTMDGRTVYLEWENWKKQGTDYYHFGLEPGKGYLYAHNPTIDAVFIGELANPQNGDIQVSYSTSNPSLDMHGWNLIGNPFTCNAYINRSYYRINNDGNGIQVVENNAAILPCTGILVKTENPNGETVTFTKEPQTNGAKGSLNITLANANTRNNAIVDNAIVTFNKDNELGKFYFGQSNANIYFPKNGEDYAIAYAHGMDEMPLNFRADENGSYTLTINPKDIELDYLHLIDNMTGANVDLLATPSYTFEAKTTDYASRFRLLFAPISEDADSDNATFAFISDGNIVVNGEGILQIVDVTGRVIISRRGDVSGNVSTNGMEPGVYVLRLINGANMMTQKIVIE